MRRICTHCQTPFTAIDFDKEGSREMEHEREAMGLKGLFFRRYHCPSCGCEDVFLDLWRLEGESEEDFRQRKREFEAMAQQHQVDKGGVVVQERPSHEVSGPN